MSNLPGIAHIALTVSDLDESAPWYERLFGNPPDVIADGEPFRLAVWHLNAGTILALHQFVTASIPDSFDEHRPGLDHVAFGCADRADLECWRDRLDTLAIEHGEIVDERHGSGLSFRDPDNIALEFFAPPKS